MAQPPLTQVAAPWDVVQLAARIGGRRFPGEMLGPRIAWLTSWCLLPARRSAPFRLMLELGAVAVVGLAFVGFWVDLGAREEDRINRAWSLVAAAKEEGAGNVGLIEALQTLNERGIDLSNIRLPGAYLQNAQLSAASLSGANFSSIPNPDGDDRWFAVTDLRSSDLSGGDLREAVFSGADLNRSDFSGADLAGAEFSNASLRHADLSYAYALSYGIEEEADVIRIDNWSGFINMVVPMVDDIGHGRYSTVDFSFSDLYDADLSDVVFWAPDFTKSRLINADLSGAEIYRASFIGARLDGLRGFTEDLTRYSIFCRTILPDRRVSYRDCLEEAPEGHVEPLPPASNPSFEEIWQWVFKPIEP